MPRTSKEKNAEYQRKWYLKNKALQIARNEANKRKKKKFLADYKVERGCRRCGENHVACLQFHHTDPAEKKVNLSRLVQANVSIENLMREIEKCVVLCANCHFKLHYHERGRHRQVGELV
jgi:hypothetical protein